MGVDRHQPIDVERVGNVDVDDSGMSMRASDERGSEGGVTEVVEVATLAGEQPGVFAAGDRFPHRARAHTRASRRISAARSTEATMFWYPVQRHRFPGDRLTGLLRGRLRVLVEVRGDRGDEPRRAEAALQPVAVPERLLDRTERPVRLAAALDGRDRRPVDAHREQQARADRSAVDQHGAGSAHAVLATDMGTGEAEVVPKGVGEQPPRRHTHGARHAVDGQLDARAGRSCRRAPHARAAASVSARSAKVPARWRRYSAVAWMSASGSTASFTIRRCACGSTASCG